MTSVRKLDFFAHFDLNFLDDDKVAFVDIHHADFVGESHDYV